MESMQASQMEVKRRSLELLRPDNRCWDCPIRVPSVNAEKYFSLTQVYMWLELLRADKRCWDCPIRVPSVNAEKELQQTKNQKIWTTCLENQLLTVYESKLGLLAPSRLSKKGKGEGDNHKGEQSSQPDLEKKIKTQKLRDEKKWCQGALEAEGALWGPATEEGEAVWRAWNRRILRHTDLCSR